MAAKNIKFGELNSADEKALEAIRDLVLNVYRQTIADEMTAVGRQNFEAFMSVKSLRQRCQDGSRIAIVKSQKRIVGILELSESHHIFLFFVDPDYHRQGIGRLLMDWAKRANGDYLTAYSTEYALAVYMKLGFSLNGAPYKANGITSYPVVWRPVTHI